MATCKRTPPINVQMDIWTLPLPCLPGSRESSAAAATLLPDRQPRSHRAHKIRCWAGCHNRHLSQAVVPARSTSARPSHQPNAGQDHSDSEARYPEV
jgi:hypothetical protein